MTIVYLKTRGKGFFPKLLSTYQNCLSLEYNFNCTVFLHIPAFEKKSEHIFEDYLLNRTKMLSAILFVLNQILFKNLLLSIS